MNNGQPSAAHTGFLRELFLTREDGDRCFGSLAKLARHTDAPVVLTGSIAAGWHLLNAGRRIKRRPLNDIDTVAVAGLPHVRPSVSRDFLINHFHPARPRGKVLLQLVDAEHGTRTEVFTPATDSLAERLSDCAVGPLACRVVSAEDAAAKLLSIICCVLEDRPVDPKYVEHFDQLATVADMTVTREVWRDYRQETQHAEFDAAAAAVKARLATDPTLLQPEHYCQDVDFVCAWCQESASFPVAPRAKVYDVLGYV
ncbi:MAG TPA: hypothetical protein VF546_08345 [Pyrinomonadaceae bacterium]|jgi:hypothetical protein